VRPRGESSDITITSICSNKDRKVLCSIIILYRQEIEAVYCFDLKLKRYNCQTIDIKRKNNRYLGSLYSSKTQRIIN